MKRFPKNCLLPNRLFFIVGLFLYVNVARAQIANFVANGSFEDFYNCNAPYDLSKIKYWSGADSLFSGVGFQSLCNSNIPLNANAYQFPRTGNSHLISGFYCLLQNCGRGYSKNRMKHNLEAGTTYCVKFHVNITNMSPRGIDGFGIYFGDNMIDTISRCTIPLTYLNPQVKNPLGNVISDTLNWVPITGTFVANGTEKYALIGNFLADNAVTTASINTPYYPAYWTDVLIDDVSCIDIDLPAFAGLDTFFIPGTNLYLGRERDVGIDEACIWYQLPNMTTAIDTAAGIWVTPVGTSTYVVRQEICGNVKWDTVVVRESPLGLEDLRLTVKGLKVWPVPAKEEAQLQLEGYIGNARLMIFNNLGVVMRDEDLIFKENKAVVRVGDLAAGSYVIELRAKESSYRSKLVVER